MKSSSVLAGGSLGRTGPTRCFCGEKPVVVMSWTVDNPGKRFYGYPNYWVMPNIKEFFFLVFCCDFGKHTYGFNLWFQFQVGNKCRFFEWRDDEICQHGKVLIPKERQWIIILEAQIASCKRREKFLAGMSALSLVIYGICLRVIMSLVR